MSDGKPINDECQTLNCENEPIGAWPPKPECNEYCDEHAPNYDIALEIYGGLIGYSYGY